MARNGDVVRGAFIIDAHDREVISWHAVVNAGISGILHPRRHAPGRRSQLRHLPGAVHHRDADRSDHRGAIGPSPMARGSPCIARDTQIFARQPGLKPCFTPVQSPHGNGIAEAFVKTREPRLRPGHADPGRSHSAWLDCRMVRGSQREPPTFRDEDALAPRVHRSSNRNRLSVR